MHPIVFGALANRCKYILTDPIVLSLAVHRTGYLYSDGFEVIIEEIQINLLLLTEEARYLLGVTR